MARRPSKSREPGDIVQTNVRLRASDHAWLVQEAKSHRQTLNSEIVWRLSNSRLTTTAIELQLIVETVVPRLEPYLITANERDYYNEALVVARDLADICAAQVAAGKIEGKAAQRVEGAIKQLHFLRYNLELVADAEGTIGQGYTSFRAAAEARAEAEAARAAAEGRGTKAGMEEAARQARLEEAAAAQRPETATGEPGAVS